MIQNYGIGTQPVKDDMPGILRIGDGKRIVGLNELDLTNHHENTFADQVHIFILSHSGNTFHSSELKFVDDRGQSVNLDSLDVYYRIIQAAKNLPASPTCHFHVQSCYAGTAFLENEKESKVKVVDMLPEDSIFITYSADEVSFLNNKLFCDGNVVQQFTKDRAHPLELLFSELGKSVWGCIVANNRGVEKFKISQEKVLDGNVNERIKEFLQKLAGIYNVDLEMPKFSEKEISLAYILGLGHDERYFKDYVKRMKKLGFTDEEMLQVSKRVLIIGNLIALKFLRSIKNELSDFSAEELNPKHKFALSCYLLESLSKHFCSSEVINLGIELIDFISSQIECQDTQDIAFCSGYVFRSTSYLLEPLYQDAEIEETKIEDLKSVLKKFCEFYIRALDIPGKNSSKAHDAIIEEKFAEDVYRIYIGTLYEFAKDANCQVNFKREVISVISISKNYSDQEKQEMLMHFADKEQPLKVLLGLSIYATKYLQDTEIFAIEPLRVYLIIFQK